MGSVLAHSLLARTVALICAPLLLAVVVTIAVAIDHARDDARDALAERAARTADLLAGGAGEALWEMDRRGALALLRPLEADPDFAGALILDAGDDVFVAFGTVAGIVAGQGVILKRIPLVHGAGAVEQRIGTLELRLATARAEQTIRRRAWTIALLGGGMLTLVCGLLVLGVRDAMRPVRAMTAAMTDLAAGRVDVPVPATARRDEIGRMAAALGTLKEHAAERLRFIERQSHLMEEVESTVRERTRALEEALETLRHAQDELVRSEKMAALGGMVAAMAHEINTPLGNGLTVATTLADRIAEFRRTLEGTELRRSVLRDCSASLDTASRLLIGNLTRAAALIGSFKRVAVDQTSELRRGFELDVACAEIVAMLRPGYKHKAVAILLDLPPGIVMDSYPGALGQALTNLVANAMLHGFGEAGAGTIRIAATAAGDGGPVTLTVGDDGAGIDPAVLPRIFDPFVTTRFGAGGSGLGLHIVYAIVTRVLGGCIAVESAPGQGTLFTLVLPRTAP